MIAIQREATAGTVMSAFRQGFCLPVSTRAAILRGIGRVHRNELTTGTRCLVRQRAEEPRPGRVVDTFREAMVMNHAVRMQVLDGDHRILFNDTVAVLMNEVLAFIRDTLMHPGDDFPAFLVLGCPLFRFGKAALRLRQFLLFQSNSPRWK